MKHASLISLFCVGFVSDAEQVPGAGRVNMERLEMKGGGVARAFA